MDFLAGGYEHRVCSLAWRHESILEIDIRLAAYECSYAQVVKESVERVPESLCMRVTVVQA